jgi:hypothetical protein
LLQLTQHGNTAVNQRLCGLPKPWFLSPEQFSYQAVHRLYIQAKYKYLLFAREPASLEVRRSLEDYWFYIEEVSDVFTAVSGPVPPSDLRTKYTYGDMIRKETYVWHPLLGGKWLPWKYSTRNLFSSLDLPLKRKFTGFMRCGDT